MLTELPWTFALGSQNFMVFPSGTDVCEDCSKGQDSGNLLLFVVETPKTDSEWGSSQVRGDVCHLN